MKGIINVVVKSKCPMMHNNPDGSEALKDRGKVDYNDPKIQKIIFNAASYHDKKGKYYIPSTHFEKVIELAGSRFKFQGKLTYNSIVKGGIIVLPTEIYFDKGIKPTMDIRWGRIPPGPKGALVKLIRPYFEKWSAKFQIDVLNDAIDFDTLHKILMYAGGYIGIGAWHPKFGRFDVVKFEQH